LASVRVDDSLVHLGERVPNLWSELKEQLAQLA
jgi:hypothetical protein